MLSSYTGFDAFLRLSNGGITMMPSIVVKVRDITDEDPVTGVGAVALPDINADANGHVAAGTLAIAAGRSVRFGWVRDVDMKCGFCEQVTF